MIGITYEDAQQATLLVDHLQLINAHPASASALSLELTQWRWLAGLNAPTPEWRAVWAAVSEELLRQMFAAKRRWDPVFPGDLRAQMEQFARRLHPAVDAELHVRRGVERGPAVIAAVLHHNPSHLEALADA